MSQAKTLTQAEIEQVLAYIATRRFALRNRVMLLVSFLSGMRVGEISALKVSDVANTDGTVKAEVRLSAEQTKGRQPRTVFLNEKLRVELQRYLDLRRAYTDPAQILFVTAGSKAFTANGLALHFFWLYRKAGIAGASSHSGRRTFATRISECGVGIKILQSILGHRSISTTAVYIFASDEMKRKAVNLI